MLSIGMKDWAPGERLEDTQVAYDSIESKELGLKCTMNVRVPLEASFNQYMMSKNEWQTRIDDYACKVEGVALGQDSWALVENRKSMPRAEAVLASPAALARTSNPGT